MIEKQFSFNDYHFPTQFIHPLSPYSEHGTVEHITYQAHFDDTGHYELVESGKINTYEEIQSHKDGVDIHILLQRYAEGDLDVLSRVQGAYFDATQAPHTYAEMLNNLIVAENAFYQLPVDERAKFDHSFEVWLSSFDSAASHSVPASSSSSDVPASSPAPSVDPSNVSPSPASPVDPSVS